MELIIWIRSPAGEPRRLRHSTGKSLRAAFRIRPPNTQTQKRDTPNGVSLFWWGRTDSNHRSDTQQIYSLSPLATRELPRIKLCSGAGRRTRTPDLLITNQLLYQLSYTGGSTEQEHYTTLTEKVKNYFYFFQKFRPIQMDRPE